MMSVGAAVDFLKNPEALVTKLMGIHVCVCFVGINKMF